MSSRSFYQQLEILTDFLSQSPGIAKRLLRTAHAKQETKIKWNEISLNALGDAQKDGKGWAKIRNRIIVRFWTPIPRPRPRPAIRERRRTRSSQSQSRTRLDQESERFLAIERQRVEAKSNTARALSDAVNSLTAFTSSLDSVGTAIRLGSERIGNALNNIANAL